eukprot:GEMP01072602.1.p1 GENE.GEMP01072602.1~~GEMP01072602.1.p1  ORF type:complete len:231 (+),score=34.23 GEMP01072602.1:136-828(+)
MEISRRTTVAKFPRSLSTGDFTVDLSPCGLTSFVTPRAICSRGTWEAAKAELERSDAIKRAISQERTVAAKKKMMSGSTKGRSRSVPLEESRYLTRKYPQRDDSARVPPQHRAAYTLSLLAGLNAHNAFPFGKSEFPFVPQRKGGSYMATTDCKMRQFLEYEDAMTTSKSIYETDSSGGSSWGMTPFVREYLAYSAKSATGGIFDTLGDSAADDYNLIYESEEKHCRYLQ